MVMVSAQGRQRVAGARSRRRSRQAAGRVRSVRFGLTEEEYEEVGTAAADAGLAKGAYAAQATLAAAGACSARRGFSVPAGADRTDPRGRAGPPDRGQLKSGGGEAERHRAALGGSLAVRGGEPAESGTPGRRGGGGAEASAVIGKVLRGGRPNGLIRYLYGPGKREEHTDPHLVAGWRDPAELEPPLRRDGRRDFRRLNGLLSQPHAALGPQGFDQPVWHCVVRAAHEDRMLSDEEWGRLARDVMDRTGLAPRGQDDEAVRWVAVRHADDHIHVVAMLARQDGARPRFWNDFYRVREACQAAEERHGLRRTAPGDRTAGRRPTRAESEKARRHGRPEIPRVTLRRAVSAAAAGAASEEDFFARLRDAGVLVRTRFSTRDPGQVTGYAVALADDTARTGGPVWFGGGKLAADLSLPKLRCRWGDVSAGPRLDDPLTVEERNAIWEHAARAAADARDQIRAAAGDPGAVSDAAWAASDTLHVAAAALGSRVVRQAADSYARAARMPYARIPRPTPAGNGLRQAARMLSRAALVGHEPTAVQTLLIVRLAALVEAVIELCEAQQRAAQAAAARRAAEHLHAVGRRLSRRTETRAARSARLAAESFPTSPWAAPRASGWHEPARTGPHASRGPGAPRPRGPTR
jgi:hypothetical protein